MKYKYAICLFSVALIIQTTLMNIVSVFGATPNLLLCLVIMMSFLYDYNNSGLVLGVAFGLLYDICFSEYVGITALGFFVVSLFVMLINIALNKESVFSVVIVAAASTVIYTLMYWSIMAMLGSSYKFLYMIQFLPAYVFLPRIIRIYRCEYKAWEGLGTP